ncbi:MAG TPA: hypothetical protein VFO30_05115, partial [Chthoniobacterales bacterium]|nr:hypothetical protein [Chthoniobacterales bacterium]
MRNFVLATVIVFSLPIASAQQLTPNPSSTPAASSDVESLRQQVQALTETVKTLQQQVQDQQARIDRMNEENAPEQPEPSP